MKLQASLYNTMVGYVFPLKAVNGCKISFVMFCINDSYCVGLSQLLSDCTMYDLGVV